MSDCDCRTVKFYDDKKEWRCMMCYRKFEPYDAHVTEVRRSLGHWVFIPFGVEKHGTG